MPRTRLQKTLRLLLDRPSPADVTGVVRATPIGASITMVNASILTVASWSALGGLSLVSWLWGTLAISLYVLRRSLRAQEVLVTRVSRRAARKLVLTSFLLALPWALLAAAIVPFGSPTDRLIGLLTCAGMALAAALMLQRTIGAAVTYVATVSVAIICGCLLTGEPAMIVVALYNVLLSGFVTYCAYLAGQTAKERDRMLGRLTAANRELEEAYAKISSSVFHDAVTGMPNRKAYIEALEREITAAQKDGRPRAVMIFDLDDFKNVNDSFGHMAGDALLTLSGERIHGVLGDVGMAARLGGDEFALVSVIDGENRSMEALAKALIDALSVPTTILDRQIFPSTSIGIAVTPDHGQSASDLMQKADAALAQAKERGKGGWSVFDVALGQKLENSDLIGAELKLALATGGLAVDYQPKVHLETGALGGAEALVRWEHPTLGTVRPDTFLRVASERAMMHDLTSCVFENVARDILAWRAQNIDPGRIAINIHPMDLKDPDHLIRLLERMMKKGIGPADVSLEVTEGCLMGRGTDAAPMILDAIAEMGFRLSLDDFGSGHAALSYLRDLPVDEIKVDRVFIANVVSSQSDQSIVEATIAFARGMGLKSVAEGVETLDQIEVLRRLGTDFGQGYLWSRPLAPDAFADFVGAHRAGLRPEGQNLERRTLER